jgi:hypothetical protein
MIAPKISRYALVRQYRACRLMSFLKGRLGRENITACLWALRLTTAA